MMKYLDEALLACETLVAPKQEAVAGLDSDSFNGDSFNSDSFNSDSFNNDLIMQWMTACQTVGNILMSMGFVEESYCWQTMALDAEPDAIRFYEESDRLYRQCEAWEQVIYFTQRRLEYQPDNEEVYR